MKVSLNWIRDYVQLPADADLKKLAYDLTMSTVEVEGAEDLARRFVHMRVGRIVEVCPHPNADKLQICRTDIGGGDIRDIVCGGTNVRPGMKVAVAAPGAMCRWHGEGEPVEIKEAKLRGVRSYGMICGAVEIGLGDLFPTTEEAHILDLSAFDAPAGTPIADALDLHDIILEIDNKSMTNRPDLWGHYGIARELAALYHLPMKTFPHFDRNVENTSGFHVTVEDAERCPRMTGTLTGNEVSLLCLMAGKASKRVSVIDGAQYKTRLQTRVKHRIDPDGTLFVSLRLTLTLSAGQQQRTGEEIAASLAQDCVRVLHKLQAASCDAVGFGRIQIRRYPDIPAWERSGWAAQYESRPVRVNAEIKILQ